MKSILFLTLFLTLSLICETQTEVESKTEPQEEANNKEQQEGASNKDKLEGASNKDQKEGANNKDQQEGANNKDEKEGASNKDQKEGTSNKDQQEGASNKDKQEGASNKDQKEEASNKNQQGVGKKDQLEGANKMELQDVVSNKDGQEYIGSEQILADLLEGGIMKEEWSKIKAVLCDPKKGDDAMINAMNKCVLHKTGLGKYLVLQLINKIYEECGKPNEDDIKDFTFVGNPQNKKDLMFRCSEKMKTCVKDKWKTKKDELKAKTGQFRGGIKLQINGDLKKKLSEKLKNTKLTVCVRKAVKLDK